MKTKDRTIIMTPSNEPQSTSEQSLTRHAPDSWESARFQEVCVAWSWFRQSSCPSTRPPALITLARALRWGATQSPAIGLL